MGILDESVLVVEDPNPIERRMRKWVERRTTEQGTDDIDDYAVTDVDGKHIATVLQSRPPRTSKRLLMDIGLNLWWTWSPTPRLPGR